MIPAETFLQALARIDPAKPFPTIGDADVIYMGTLVTYRGHEADHYMVQHPDFVIALYVFGEDEPYEPTARLWGDRDQIDHWIVEFILTMGVEDV